MNKNLRAGRAVFGALMVLVGLLWTLQGLGYVGTQGQGMTGVTLWAIVGPIVAVIGAIVVWGSVRARRR